MITVLELMLSFGIPLYLLKHRSGKLVSTVGHVGLAYLAGILYAVLAQFAVSTGLIPARDTSVAEILAYVCISLAIPLLLFPNSIKNVLRLSRTVLLSFGLLIAAVLLTTIALYFVLTRKLDHGNVLSGMAVALYTGGTPNLNAVACLFRLDSNLILTANISDIIFGGFFYVFLMFAAKPMLSAFLKDKRTSETAMIDTINSDAIQISFSPKSIEVLRNLLLAFAILLFSFGAGILIWALKGSVEGTMTNYVVPALMIGATLGGIVASFCNKIASVKENALMGQYFATVFSYSIASIINIGKLSLVTVRIFAVFAIITTVTFAVHALLCKLFGIGADTMIITSTAGIYGPAFIPSVSKAIHADYLLPSGLIIGSLGYVIGTFLGIACTYFLSLF